jgi:polysaccharide biosynthesis/export protein
MRLKKINDLKGALRPLMLLCLGLTVVAAVNGQDTTLQASVNENRYLIGPGDVLDIRVYNRPLLSRESVRVDERGMIRLPLAGEIKAQCRTESSLADAVSKSYLEYLKNPNVEVFVKDYQSKPVMVLGAVRTPGRFQLQRSVTLTEIISLAGGLSETAGGRTQITHSATRPVCDEAYSESGETVEWYDIDELLKTDRTGKPIPFVQPGDTINVLEADRAFIVGNVLKPSVIPLKETVSVSQAVAFAGGTLADTRTDRVRILRQSTPGGPKSEIIVDLKAINRQEAEDVLLQSNDIIEVPTSTGRKILRGILNGITPNLSRVPVQVIR